MEKSPTDNYVDIELFQRDIKDIDQEFIQSIESIYKISTFANEVGFLFMTNDANYVYGNKICKWLSLQHNPKRPQQIDILNDKKIIQVDSGEDFVVVLTDDGLVYLASGNSRWQTNNTLRLISTGNDRFEMIACGQDHLLLLRQDGTVFALGYNQSGQLTGNSHSSYDTLVNTGLKNVKIIAGGGGHSLALTNNNQIYSWGWNYYGQLGLWDRNDRKTPSLVSFPDGSIDSSIKNIVAGIFHSLFLLEDGQIFGWGYGQQNAKVQIENVQSVVCKNDLNFSLALDQSSHYYVLGMMNNGVSLPPKKLDGQPKSFAEASALINESPMTFGLTSTVNVSQSNNPKSFIEISELFNNPISFIGLLNNPDNYDVEFVIGNKHILASKCHLKMSSHYYSRMFSGDWKENSKVVIKDYHYDVYYAYLRMLHTGQIRINQSNIGQLIDLANCYGDEQLMKHCRTFIRNNLNEQTLSTYLPLIDKYQLDEMNDKLVQLTIENVLPKNKKNIAKFLLFIESIYKISTFANEVGFLFMTNDANYVYGNKICKWLSLQHDPKRPQQIHILNDKKIIQVDSGNDFVVILTVEGLVYLAKRKQTNKNLRLISTGNDRFEMIACGQNHLLLLRQDGTVFALGYNQYGQLTGNSESSYDTLVNTGLKNVKIIAGGGRHNLALTNNNQIYSWGWNYYGQLGLGDTNERKTPSLVSFPDGSIDSPIKNIVAGMWHSLFLLEDGQIFGCGYGQHPINYNKQNAKVSTKIPIENVQSVACRNDLIFSLALDQSSHYYAWGMMNNGVSLKKLDGQLKSFAEASAMVDKSPITFGLTSTVNSKSFIESSKLFNNPISLIGLLNNPDNYDVEFVIGNKRILASKCHLKMSSHYYSRMFSGDWKENSKVVIKDYHYDVYYAYLRMLHTGQILIKQSNIDQLIDLANCYGDEQLMKHCRTFIRNNLNERTLSTLSSLD
ncbi:RCC1 and BTB domain-containing protein 2 [Dermatophagoides pteronyssinus]|uniref:RCC1 and BTB domain-containing protein 2 n=1 Tax=Dermatophagoides pteronyssinus TaxID=6956 RepID=A0ABQ8IWX5_DERPT|nr:RCC1 and BTB domain-containing protein 2 [Dermatophagoides pteronyssinus]